MVTIRTAARRFVDVILLFALGLIYVLALSAGTLLTSIGRLYDRLRGRWRSLGARLRGTPDSAH